MLSPEARPSLQPPPPPGPPPSRGISSSAWTSCAAPSTSWQGPPPPELGPQDATCPARPKLDFDIKDHGIHAEEYLVSPRCLPSGVPPPPPGPPPQNSLQPLREAMLPPEALPLSQPPPPTGPPSPRRGVSSLAWTSCAAPSTSWQRPPPLKSSPQDDTYSARAKFDFDIKDHGIHGDEYLVFEQNAMITVLPTPTQVDPAGWLYGSLDHNGQKGWFPPACIEDCSVQPDDSASHSGSFEDSEAAGRSHEACGSLISCATMDSCDRKRHWSFFLHGWTPPPARLAGYGSGWQDNARGCPHRSAAH
jgi:hypothetical protein